MRTEIREQRGVVFPHASDCIYKLSYGQRAAPLHIIRLLSKVFQSQVEQEHDPLADSLIRLQTQTDMRLINYPNAFD